jgi:hypothetical protein
MTSACFVKYMGANNFYLKLLSQLIYHQYVIVSHHFREKMQKSAMKYPKLEIEVYFTLH